MGDTLLRLDKVLERTGLSKRTVYRLMAQNEFPRQIRLSHKVAMWPEREIDDWVANVIARAA